MMKKGILVTMPSGGYWTEYDRPNMNIHRQPLRCRRNVDELVESQKSVKILLSQLERLRQEHNNLIARIRKASGVDRDRKDIDLGMLFLEGHEPTEVYENLRRRIYSNTKDLWYFVHQQLKSLISVEVRRAGDRENHNVKNLERMLDEVSARKNSLLSDQEKLSESDGHHAWRQAEAANVSDLIQRRLHHLQNPPDCRAARKVVCNMNSKCGFGCIFHNIVHCMVFAYATERTLILYADFTEYVKCKWFEVFNLFTDSCTTTYDDEVRLWTGSDNNYKVVMQPIDYSLGIPKFLPLAVPKDLAHRIIRFNGDPSSWWIGQMVKFLMRPRAEVQQAINETIAKMKFGRPIVGIHIRRTDKVGTEAAFHHIHEYMHHVRQYYDKLELTRPVDVRRVYIATDDANVLDDARRIFPDYEFFGDLSIAKTAGPDRRCTSQSLIGLLVDLQVLASADYLVCTFSSQVGRLAYEMMQANRADASDSVMSLDDIYFFCGQNAHNRRAVLPNKGSDNDIALQVNDLIGIAGNHQDGYGLGLNRRTNVSGLVPWYKTVDELVLFPFPEYKKVPLYTDSRQKDNTIPT